MDGDGRPSAAVLRAFGVADPPVRLPGGQGGTWLAGDVVLKLAGLVAETAWRAEVCDGLPESPLFRVARPVRAADGGWVAYGWEAWHHVPGEPDVRRPDDALRAGEAFHAALRDVPRPAFLDLRDDPWTYGDRVAWGELPVAGEPRWLRLLATLAEVRRPVTQPAQVVHGDLLGNVLYAAGQPPAVIDWPVYHRPPAWAAAVAAVDALTWYAAPPELLDRWKHLPDWDQMAVRALMYRIATNEGSRRRGLPVREDPAAYRPVVDLVAARARRPGN